MADQERASKRQKKNMPDLSIDTTNTQAPNLIVDVCPDGDTVLVVPGLAGVAKPVGIRVSSSALSLTSSVFRNLFAAADGGAPPTPAPDEPQLVHLANDDGDALFLLLNILHLRNDALPPKILPDLLFRFVTVCARYECMVAAGRAVSQWLDYIYTRSLKATKLFSHAAAPNAPTTPATPTPPTPYSAFPPVSDSQSLFKMIEATGTLNDALYFARFTAHFVLTQPIINETSIATTPSQQHLALAIQARQRQALQDLRVDLDLLIDPLAETLSEDSKHYQDCAPGDEGQSSTNNEIPQYCPVDRECAAEFLAALRDANLWPATRWQTSTHVISGPVGTVVHAMENFRVPDYDATDACYWCVHVEDRFARSLNLIRAMHKDRLWGLCLDCYKAGGTFQGECRYDHYKVARAKEAGQGGGGDVARAPTSLVGGVVGGGGGGGQASAGNVSVGSTQNN